jgi:hypothetical protein
MKKALLVGINYYSVPNARLNGCINDITNITNVITKHFNYKPENITKLTDDNTNPSFIPNRANILLQLTQLINNSKNCEEIWFHYSGHGSQVRDKSGDESDGLDEVIVPIDYQTSGFILDDEIYQIIKNSRCKTILVFDSCHSASICDLQWTFEYMFNSQFKKSSLPSKIVPNPNILCYSGCKDAQTAADTYSTVLKQGVGAFTDAMIYCLTQSNMNIKCLELHKNICEYVKSQGYTQIPMFSSSTAVPYYRFVSNAKPLGSSIIKPTTSTFKEIIVDEEPEPVKKPVPNKKFMSMSSIMYHYN